MQSKWILLSAPNAACTVSCVRRQGNRSSRNCAVLEIRHKIARFVLNVFQRRHFRWETLSATRRGRWRRVRTTSAVTETSRKRRLRHLSSADRLGCDGVNTNPDVQRTKMHDRTRENWRQKTTHTWCLIFCVKLRSVG